MSFWNGETCEYCGGKLREKTVTLHREAKGKHILIENVPAAVCQECGTRYYAANVLKTINARGRRRPSKQLQVPVYSY